MAQDRKVFVGGVPQDLNQDDLYSIFNEYAVVKKAWLQKCRASDDNAANNPAQNHRGFGFVIFHYPNVIEELLGGSFSRFIVLKNGAKLEVKRALSSSKMNGVGSRSGAPSLAPPGGAEQGQSKSPPTEPALKQRQTLSTLAPPHLSAGVGPNPYGGALMPNSLQVYPNMDRGLAAADGAPLSYGGAVLPQMPPQPILPHPGLGPQVPAGLVMPSMGEQHGGLTQSSESRISLYEAILRFYEEHAPEKLAQRGFVEQICAYYQDKQHELDESLRQKYKAGLVFQSGGDAQRSLLQSAAPKSPSPPGLTAAGVSTSSQSRAGSGPHNGMPFPPAGRTKGEIEPMYAGQLGPNAQLGLEPNFAPGLAPPQLPKPKGEVNQPAGLGSSSFSASTDADLSSYESERSAAITIMAASRTWGSGSTHGSAGSRSATDGSASAPVERKAALPAAKKRQGDKSPAGAAVQNDGDAGFEISVEVAEAILGNTTLVSPR